MPKAIDRTGQRRGRLVYLRLIGTNKFKQRLWEARCDCSRVVVVQATHTRSCGCLLRERASAANKHPKSEETKRKVSETKRIKGTRHICPVCNKEFLGTKIQRFCSVKPCQRKYFDTRNGKSRALAATALTGAAYEPISFWKVYERDGGICQVCLKEPPKELRGSTSDMRAPTLGHVIPLSQGGGHTYANVQLECLGCNLSKGNKLPEGVVPEHTNPDPRTKEKKISEETKKAMARPEVRARFLAGIAKRVLPKQGPEQADALKQWWAAHPERRIFSDETRAKMSEASKARSPEVNDRHTADLLAWCESNVHPCLDVHPSDETKQKISETMKRVRAENPWSTAKHQEPMCSTNFPGSVSS
jgi:hypothetical protein